MHRMLTFAKTTLLGGVLVVLPAWVAALLVIKGLMQLQVLVVPVSAQLPQEVAHPKVIAALLLVVLCFIVGLTLRTAVGRQVTRSVENRVLRKLPGYSTLSSVAKQMGELHENRGFRPALVEIEEGLAPGFIVEEHPDGRFTVFIPSAPTPAAGTILILTASRVHPVDVSVGSVFKCVTQWGAGTGKLLEAMGSKTRP